MIYIPQPVNGVSIYIHIPLCGNLCPWCHFYRVPPGDEVEGRYLDALAAEMDTAVQEPVSRDVRTVYVGGGTPTLLSPDFYQRLFSRLGDRFDLGGMMEATIETDGRVSGEELLGYSKAGFNRISIGVKAFSQFHVRILGIGHAPSDTHRVVELARSAGFQSVGLDLLYGFEGQGQSDLLGDLETALLTGADHISLYALQERQGAGPREAPGDETARMYRALRRRLVSGGYRQYEISNFARQGHQCLHNVNYWSDGDFLGLGPSAHSAVTADDTRTRWCNREDLEAYLAHPTACRLTLSSEGPRERPSEALMMALRRTDGVVIDDFIGRYRVDPRAVLGQALGEFKAYGLLRASQNRLRLTTRGMLLSNEIFVKLV
jgi:oxygen-independent coproporphyrinogen-3 oxidase